MNEEDLDSVGIGLMILDKFLLFCYQFSYQVQHLEDFITRIFEKNEILSYLAMSLNLTYDISVSYSLQNRGSLSITDKENKRGKIEWILKMEDSEKNFNLVYTRCILSVTR